MSTKILAATLVLMIGGSVTAQDCPGTGYLAENPPPDANKVLPLSNLSCWLATASNMLAAAGYGEGDTMQARAESIYQQLEAHYSGSV